MLRGVLHFNSVLKQSKHKFGSRWFSTSGNNILVIAESSKGKISSGTLATIGAAKKIGGDVNLLVSGNLKGDDSLAKQAAKLDGVTRVIVADNPELDHGLPEV